MIFFQQPQRPTRLLRVYGDENAVPTITAQKTLHHRNKSSPSLSTVQQAGGLKIAAKRTAFGDVSNTTNVLRPSKDDSVIGGKGDYVLTEKALPALLDKRTTSLLRPAQRPLSIGGIKGLLHNVTNSINQPSVKQPLVELQQSIRPSTQPANTRKIVSKKSKIVLNDAIVVQPEQSAPDIQKAPPSQAPSAPVHPDLLPRNQPTQLEESQRLHTDLRRKPSKYITEQGPQGDTVQSLATSSEELAALRSDGIYIDHQSKVQTFKYEAPVQREEVHKEVSKPDVSAVLDPILINQQGNARTDPARNSMLVPVSEPEEYWDDEAEENFDEDGYVTARSFKSRGENTTGGATTVLVPKITLKAKKEIAAAKDLIEGSKTAEEIEDEAWDTTMVAEYGEEIFSYMKDLEV